MAGPEARATLLDRTYAAVEAEDGQVTRVTLTPEGEQVGLIVTLPETVVLARPAGIGRGSAIAYRIRIVGRTEELDAIRRLKLV